MNFDDLIDDSQAPKAAPAAGAPPGVLPNFDALEDDSEKYGTLGQQAIAGLEGVGEGIAGPASTALERGLGVPLEDIRGRREANPWTHGLGQVAGLATGLGLGEGVGALGEAVGEASGLTGLAKTAVKTGSELAALQSSDEVSRLIMNDPNQSLQTAVADIGLAALLGAGAGALFGAAGAGAKALSSKTEGFLSDFADRLKMHFGVETPSELPPEVSIPAAAPASEPGGESFFTKRVFSKKGPPEPAVPTETPETAPLPEGSFFKKLFRKDVPSDVATPTPTTLPDLESTRLPLGTAIPEPKLSPGQKLADYLVQKGLGKISASGLGPSTGFLLGKATGLPGAGTMGAFLGDKALMPFFETILPAIGKPFAAKVMNSAGVKAAADYGMSVIRGGKLMKNAAASVLGLKSSDILKSFDATSADTEKLDKKLASYEESPADMLQIGGALDHYLPNHASALGETAAQATRLLNAQRPKESQAMAFDAPRVPLEQEKAQWQRTLSLAQQPLYSMKLLNEGRLTHKDLQTVQTLYPDFYKSMRQNLMASLIEAKDKKIEIPYEKRTALALFLGEPLDSTMTPQSIQSIQGLFAVSGAQAQKAMAAAGAPKKRSSPSKLQEIASMSQTADQAREKDRQMKG